MNKAGPRRAYEDTNEQIAFESGWREGRAAAAAESRELLDALIDLHDQCGDVSPFSNAVATRASIQDIRRVGRFMAAMDRAKAALAKATSGTQADGEGQ
jgi:hypothetical protein